MTYVYLKFGQYAESETSDLTINKIGTMVNNKMNRTISSRTLG